MTEVNQDFDLHAGNSRVLEVSVTDKSDTSVLDLTGVTTLTWVMSNKPGGTAEVTKTLGSGVVITDAVNGILQVTLVDTDTKDVTPGRYYHEVFMIDSSARPFTITIGNVNLLPAQTKAP